MISFQTVDLEKNHEGTLQVGKGIQETFLNLGKTQTESPLSAKNSSRKYFYCSIFLANYYHFIFFGINTINQAKILIEICFVLIIFRKILS